MIIHFKRVTSWSTRTFTKRPNSLNALLPKRTCVLCASQRPKIHGRTPERPSGGSSPNSPPSSSSEDPDLPEGPLPELEPGSPTLLPATRFSAMFERNQNWVSGLKKMDPDFFERNKNSQHPWCLVIGCSDSRVPFEEIAGLQPGEAFVHRNIGNVVNHTDTNVQAVIQFAIENLAVHDVIVIGHYGCGGVNAAMQNVDHGGALEMWLTSIRDVVRLHQKELDAIENPTQRWRRLVELNCEEQVMNILKSAPFQREYRIRGDRTPRVHGVVYDIETGIMHSLRLDLAGAARKLGSIYQLYVDSFVRRRSENNNHNNNQGGK